MIASLTLFALLCANDPVELPPQEISVHLPTIPNPGPLMLLEFAQVDRELVRARIEVHATVSIRWGFEALESQVERAKVTADLAQRTSVDVEGSTEHLTLLDRISVAQPHDGTLDFAGPSGDLHVVHVPMKLVVHLDPERFDGEGPASVHWGAWDVWSVDVEGSDAFFGLVDEWADLRFRLYLTAK